MDRTNLESVSDTPSCLLRELGVRGKIFLLYGGMRGGRSALQEKSRIVPCDAIDDYIRTDHRYWVLREGFDRRLQCLALGSIDLRDVAGSEVRCVGFCFNPTLREFFCELSLKHLQVDPIRVLSVRAMRSVSHSLLSFENILTLPYRTLDYT